MFRPDSVRHTHAPTDTETGGNLMKSKMNWERRGKGKGSGRDVNLVTLCTRVQDFVNQKEEEEKKKTESRNCRALFSLYHSRELWRMNKNFQSR